MDIVYPIHALYLIIVFSLLVICSYGAMTENRESWQTSRRLKMVENEDNNNNSNNGLKIVFKEGARNWTDALPIGNGRIGAMIHGAVFYEIINLNDDTLWTGIPKDYTDPKAPKALAIVRQLVDNGNYSEATIVADKELAGQPSDVYQLLGDLKLDFHDQNSSNYSEQSYLRELDLNTALVTVNYSVGDVKFTREHFASNPDQVIVTKISSSKKSSLSFTVYLDSQMRHKSYIDDKNQIIMEGSCPGKRIPPRIFEVDENPKGIQFSLVLNVQIGGENGVIRNVENKKLRVENADFAVIRLVALSSFDGPFTKPSDSKKNPTLEALTMMNSVSNISYSTLYNRHLDDYQKLFHRVSLRLSKSQKTGSRDVDRAEYGPGLNGLAPEVVTTAERVRSFQTDEDPSMVELLFQYGRYLLISSSREGTQPANLQGIWNKDIEPPWDCAPHTNINLQMNYWLSLSCNLHELQEPLFNYISALAINGQKTANSNYKANGWVLHQVSDIWAKTSPDRGQADSALRPLGGAWLTTHIWEYYSYTMDKDFLETKAYPLLEGVASFLLDWWIEGKNGLLETNPSTSPEHKFTAPDNKTASVSYSSTMDVAITKEVFSIIISASQLLGKTEDDLVKRVRKAQTRLPPYRISPDGSLMEWAQDFKDPDPHHRHVSHLFGIFPGNSVTPEKNPDLCEAAKYSLIKRTEEGPGWSTVWKAALWAHLRNDQHAYRMVKHLFNLVVPDHEGSVEGGLYSNLFSAHPPFQIDANFGFSAAIAEMLVQSSLTDVHLMPAFPREKWSNGWVNGLKARGGLTINIWWNEGDLLEFELSLSKNISSVKRVHYRGTSVVTRISSGKVYAFDRELKCVNVYSAS